MKICKILAIALVLLFISQNFVFAKNTAYYCYDSFDQYRQIKYWAEIYVSVYDYNYNSNDSSYLGLTYKNPEKKYRDETNKEIVTHFNKEFKRLIKGNLPFHNTEKGHDERFLKVYKKYGNDDNFLEILNAQEEARRTSLYGPNPGALFCLIKIERREFPVLYEMECSIVANKDLYNRNGLVAKKLGYSTPEHILGELKTSITELLKKLNNKMKIINDCE